MSRGSAKSRDAQAIRSGWRSNNGPPTLNMPPVATRTTTPNVRALLDDEMVRRALSFFEAQADEITKEHVRMCSIPAPPFGEAKRARHLCEQFREAGLTDAKLDEEGNCLALRKGHSLTPLLVV